MMDMPPRAVLKSQARWRMGQAMGACLTLSGVLVAAQFILYSLQISSGSGIPVYLWSTDSQTIQTGAQLSADGLFAALRVEQAGVGLSVAITPAILAAVVLAQLLTTVVLAPLKVGAIENFHVLVEGTVPLFRSVAAWYLDLKRAAGAILVELALLVCQCVLELVLSLPALLLLWRSGGDLDTISAAFWLLLAAFALAYCLMTQLAPARYLLACNPAAGPAAAFRETFRVLKGRRGSYLLFRLSFLPLEIISSLTRGVFQFYLFPYQGLSNLLWLRAARGGSVDMSAPPAPPVYPVEEDDDWPPEL